MTTGGLPEALVAAVDRLAATAALLVATDFDGVLAPIVDDPAAAAPLASSLAALDALVDLPDTAVAVVSGRDRAQLRALLPCAERYLLVGSHGAEVDDEPLDGVAVEHLGRTVVRLEEMAGRIPGLHVEAKALSVAAHYRRVPDRHRQEAEAAVAEVVAGWPGQVVEGKEVVELTLATADKGDGLTEVMRRTGATATVYLGDDLTDEDAFAVLGPDDLAVKVGPGPTRAPTRLAGPDEVGALLALLADRRA